jgi:SAM-dependent MidA family methyltransferase
MNESVEQAMQAPMQAHLAHIIHAAGGWIGFERFMHEALYAPGLGYYAANLPKLGLSSKDGSDFVTAPELSPFFGRSLARQVAQVLQATQTDTVYEFGAGTGKLAEHIISSLQSEYPGLLRHYVVVDISSHLRSVQQTRLAAFGDLVQWASELPPTLNGVLLGNEVLDAMPVQLLQRTGGIWHERGVALHENAFLSMRNGFQAAKPAWAAPKNEVASGLFCWQDRPSAAQPPYVVAGEHDYLTEIHPQAEGFIATLAERLQRGAMFFIDYGFAEAEYYHPQRSMGTLMCHHGHLADPDPLAALGQKDITAHINFTGIALAAQNAGADVLGFATQGRFLINCGLLDLLQNASLAQRSYAQKLIAEHEMGELFKVIAIGKGCSADLLGFAHGDRTHTL